MQKKKKKDENNLAKMFQQITPVILLKCLPLLKEQTKVQAECEINLYSCMHLFNQCLLSTSFVLSTILSTEGYEVNKTESEPFQKWIICTIDLQEMSVQNVMEGRKRGGDSP